MSGTIQPAFRYPRIVYNGITIDFPLPVNAWAPVDIPVAGTNLAISGKRETVFERVERQVTLAWNFMDALTARQVQAMLLNWGLQGKQCELYIDRVMRAWWGFDEGLAGGTAPDNNGGNAFDSWPTPAGLAYTTMPAGIANPPALPASLPPTDGAVIIPASGAVRAALVSTLPGGSGNFFFSPTEGEAVLVLSPAFNFSDSLEHLLLDCVTPGTGANRFYVVKRFDNLLHLAYSDANGAETIIEATPTWSSGDVVTLHLQWKALTDLTLKAITVHAGVSTTVTSTTKKYPIVASGSRISGTGLVSGQVSTTPNGGETVMNGSPTGIGVGSSYFGERGTANGSSVGMLALYTKALGLPPILETYAHPWRSYVPLAEYVLSSQGVALGRAMLERELFGYQLLFREGK